jgi:hypothetical protein
MNILICDEQMYFETTLSLRAQMHFIAVEKHGVYEIKKNRYSGTFQNGLSWRGVMELLESSRNNTSPIGDKA